MIIPESEMNFGPFEETALFQIGKYGVLRWLF